MPSTQPSASAEEAVSDYTNLEQAYEPKKTSSNLDLLKSLSFKHIKSQSTEATNVISNPRNNHDVESSTLSRREDLLQEFKSTEDSDDFVDAEKLADEEVYIVKQKKGWLSLGFSMVQTIVLIVMMIQCTIAPFQINPMIGPPPDALDYWGGKNAYKILNNNE
jgi:hypothetical protein